MLISLGRYDDGSKPEDLLGQWAHYAFVFDREIEYKVIANHIQSIALHVLTELHFVIKILYT